MRFCFSFQTHYHNWVPGFLKHSFLRGWPFQRILGIHGKLALADHIKPRMGTVTCTLLRATVVWWPLGPHHRYMYLQKLFLWGSTTADDLTKSWTTRISSPSKFVGCCVLDFLGRDHLWKMVWLSSTAWVADWKKKLHKQRQLTTAICHSNFSAQMFIAPHQSWTDWTILTLLYIYIIYIVYNSYSIIGYWRRSAASIDCGLFVFVSRHACIGVYWNCEQNLCTSRSHLPKTSDQQVLVLIALHKDYYTVYRFIKNKPIQICQFDYQIKKHEAP